MCFPSENMHSVYCAELLVALFYSNSLSSGYVFLLFICFVSLRTWPGIPTTTLMGDSDRVTVRETASVTTAKTTLGHIAAVEARDAAYKVGQWERALMGRCVCVDGVSVIAVDLYRYG